jgi:hypothetical protein
MFFARQNDRARNWNIEWMESVVQDNPKNEDTQAKTLVLTCIGMYQNKRTKNKYDLVMKFLEKKSPVYTHIVVVETNLFLLFLVTLLPVSK